MPATMSAAGCCADAISGVQLNALAASCHCAGSWGVMGTFPIMFGYDKLMSLSG
jgi:hypothetical protein